MSRHWSLIILFTWHWSADTLFCQLSINHNMDVQYQRCTYGNDVTILFFKVLGLGVDLYVRTVTWQQTFSRLMGRQILWHGGTQLLMLTDSVKLTKPWIPKMCLECWLHYNQSWVRSPTTEMDKFPTEQICFVSNGLKIM